MSTLGDKLRARLASSGSAPVKNLHVPTEPARSLWATRGEGVKDSEDLRRILALPARPPSPVDPEALVAEMNARLLRPGSPASLKPIQAFALKETVEAEGLMGLIGVGGGKCVDGDTEVFDVRTGRRRLASEPGGLSVSSYVEADRQIVAFEATAFPSGSKPCVRLYLRDGLEITLSEDHPVLTARGWVHAADLTAKDFVASATRVAEPEAATQVSDDELTLIGMLLADGGLTTRTPSYTKMNPLMVAEFIRLSSVVCGGYSEKPSNSKARHFALLGSQEFRKKWDLYGISQKKRMHPALWGLDRRQTAHLLNVLWSSDGYFSEMSGELCLAGEKLIDDARFLLLRLGVRSRKAPKKVKFMGKTFAAWRLTVGGQDYDNMLRALGPLFGRPGQGEAILQARETKRKNTNWDVVPIGRKELSEICDELGFPARWATGPRLGHGPRSTARKELGATQRQNVSRAAFIRFCKKYDYRGKYARLATEDVAWTQVKSVTPAGIRQVYDLNVPGPSNFVANGIVVHNTLVSLLVPTLLKSRVALILVPAALVPKIHRDYEDWLPHFKINRLQGSDLAMPDQMGVIYVASYTALGHPKTGPDLLSRINPDTIVADEGHKLAGLQRSSTRNRFRDHARIAARDGKAGGRDVLLRQVGVLSGSLITKSIVPAGTLGKIILGKNNPLPNDWKELESWSFALDPCPNPSPPGELVRLCAADETPRQGFRRRVTSTTGVVATSEDALENGLEFIRRDIKVPPEVNAALETLRKTWTTPTGQVFDLALEFSRYARQLATGIELYFTYPRQEPRDLIDYWFEVRAAFNKELNDYLNSPRAKPGMDSPALLEEAAEEGRWAAQHWQEWKAVRDQVQPVTEVHWISRFMVEDAVAWGKEKPGIIWTNNTALGETIAKLGGFPWYGAGAAAELQTELRRQKARTIVATMAPGGHSEGNDMQLWHRMLFTYNSSQTKRWEQAIARCHRPGQLADTVEVHYYSHTLETQKAMAAARLNAEGVAELTGQTQKLLLGTWVDE